MMTNQLIARLMIAACRWAAGTAIAAPAGRRNGRRRQDRHRRNDDAITSKIKASLADQKQIGVTTPTAW
jgi:hyperosmotically inducible protein